MTSHFKTILFGLFYLALIAPSHVYATVARKPAAPAKISIPAIRVSSAVEGIGMTNTKVLRQPSARDSVSWFNRGTAPGNIGSAVLYGHVSGQHFEPAVFAKLDKLKKNDQIIITDVHGAAFTYRVTSLKYYSTDVLTYDFLSQPSRTAVLNLFTCAGTWDKKARHYTKYLVVSGELVVMQTSK